MDALVLEDGRDVVLGSKKASASWCSGRRSRRRELSDDGLIWLERKLTHGWEALLRVDDEETGLRGAGTVSAAYRARWSASVAE